MKKFFSAFLIARLYVHAMPEQAQLLKWVSKAW